MRYALSVYINIFKPSFKACVFYLSYMQRQETEGSSSEIAMDTDEGGKNKDGATPGNLAGGSPLLLLNMSNGGQGQYKLTYLWGSLQFFLLR